ncbi:hypothetical protein C0992_002916, partial [Termitomyces sp. T32_za158]
FIMPATVKQTKDLDHNTLKQIKNLDHNTLISSGNTVYKKIFEELQYYRYSWLWLLFLDVTQNS